MIETLVYATAWAASLVFFARFAFATSSLNHAALKRMLNYVGCGLLWFHIAVAWLGFHGGSLREAWTHVAERTEQATGWYTGVGLYGNFAAAMLWAIACVLQNRAGTRGVAAKALVGIDTVLWFFFVNAAIVFARPISGTLFALLIAIVLVLRFRDRQEMVRGAPSDSES